MAGLVPAIHILPVMPAKAGIQYPPTLDLAEVRGDWIAGRAGQ
jgi:hypothetical protein